MKVLCIGQSAYDITLPMDHYPVENQKMRLDIVKNKGISLLESSFGKNS